jgi:hypothetical protein
MSLPEPLKNAPVITHDFSADLLVSIEGKANLTIYAPISNAEMPIISLGNDQSATVDETATREGITVQANVNNPTRGITDRRGNCIPGTFTPILAVRKNPVVIHDYLPDNETS